MLRQKYYLPNVNDEADLMSKIRVLAKLQLEEYKQELQPLNDLTDKFAREAENFVVKRNSRIQLIQSIIDLQNKQYLLKTAIKNINSIFQDFQNALNDSITSASNPKKYLHNVRSYLKMLILHNNNLKLTRSEQLENKLDDLLPSPEAVNILLNDIRTIIVKLKSILSQIEFHIKSLNQLDYSYSFFIKRKNYLESFLNDMNDSVENGIKHISEKCIKLISDYKNDQIEIDTTHIPGCQMIVEAAIEAVSRLKHPNQPKSRLSATREKLKTTFTNWMTTAIQVQNDLHQTHETLRVSQDNFLSRFKFFTESDIDKSKYMAMLLEHFEKFTGEAKEFLNMVKTQLENKQHLVPSNERLIELCELPAGYALSADEVAELDHLRHHSKIQQFVKNQGIIDSEVLPKLVEHISKAAHKLVKLDASNFDQIQPHIKHILSKDQINKLRPEHAKSHTHKAHHHHKTPRASQVKATFQYASDNKKSSANNSRTLSPSSPNQLRV